MELAELPLETGDMEGALEDDLEFFHLDRFGQKIVCAGADGLEGDILFALTGDDEDFCEGE